MTVRNPLWAAELFNTPILGHPDKVAIVAKVFMERSGSAVTIKGERDAETGQQMAGVLLETGPVWGYGDPYHVDRGAAIIPIYGSLINNSGDMQASSGNLGYDSVAARLRMAMDDPMVKGIFMPIDSYGGQVAGCFATADLIGKSSKRSGGKPIWAIVNEHAYSAGYALAAQADLIIGSETAGVGSIGCVIAHADYSGALKKEGVNVTLIQAGRHKTDGNPYEPLPEAVANKLQAECERVRQIFAASVAKGGRISVAQALATEADVFSGSDAVAAGLMDAVANPKDAFAAFLNEIRG